MVVVVVVVVIVAKVVKSQLISSADSRAIHVRRRESLIQKIWIGTQPHHEIHLGVHPRKVEVRGTGSIIALLSPA